MPIRILVVDDSALARHVLKDILNSVADFEVVGTAQDPYVARDMIKQQAPDVVTLDVEMPRMDGLVFLENLMRLRPTPVVMVSSLTVKGADVTLRALELGAVDFVSKPALGLAEGLREHAAELEAKIRVAAKARLQPLRAGASKGAAKQPTRQLGYSTTYKLVAMGASTGGTEALREVISALPADAPAVVVTQHIPASFSRPFAERVDRASAMSVVQAEDNQQILPGHVYIAPGDQHLEIVKSGARWLCRLSDAAPVNRHRPSVDVMFDSVVTACGKNACGVLLTGMGEDGARGMLRMKQAGAHTMIQDEASSVVWGMPGAAAKLDAAERILNLQDVPQAIVDWVGKNR
jgi:two-component system chemotaxis response regulator CheB